MQLIHFIGGVRKPAFAFCTKGVSNPRPGIPTGLFNITISSSFASIMVCLNFSDASHSFVAINLVAICTPSAPASITASMSDLSNTLPPANSGISENKSFISDTMVFKDWQRPFIRSCSSKPRWPPAKLPSATMKSGFLPNLLSQKLAMVLAPLAEDTIGAAITPLPPSIPGSSRGIPAPDITASMPSSHATLTMRS